MFVSCHSISSMAGDIAAGRLSLQGWAVSCPTRSSHVVRCQGATRHSARLLCRPSVLPVSISLSPSLLTPQTARGTAQHFLSKPDPGCARHCGRKTTWALYFSSKMDSLSFLACKQFQVMPQWENKCWIHSLLTCWGFKDRWYFVFCPACHRGNEVALHALHNAMHFLSLCVSLSPLPCQSEGWPLPSGPSPTSPAIVGHVDACLIWKHSLCWICLRTCFLTHHASQFSDIQNMLEWNQTNRKWNHLLTKW